MEVKKNRAACKAECPAISYARFIGLSRHLNEMVGVTIVCISSPSIHDLPE
jgi:hypothetical protein